MKRIYLIVLALTTSIGMNAQMYDVLRAAEKADSDIPLLKDIVNCAEEAIETGEVQGDFRHSVQSALE